MVRFKPVNRTTVSGQIVDQIKSMVRSGNLTPGDRFPSERQLSELLKAGRSSIREAMKVLETIGLIRRKRGATVLCDPAEMEHSALWLDASHQEIHEVFETRKLMEIGLSGLAAERATREDIKTMAESIARVYDKHTVITSDISFHRAVVHAAKNSVSSQVYNLVTRLLFQTHKYYLLMENIEIQEGFFEKFLAQHGKILLAVESHNVEGAKKAMEEHLEFAEKELLNKMVVDYPKPLKRKGFNKHKGGQNAYQSP
jgi:GntR family transcriptional repressor for pyruvate dehydrogenase complex